MTSQSLRDVRLQDLPRHSTYRPAPYSSSFTPLSRRALVMTETELTAIAAPAIMGDSVSPRNG